MKTKVYAIRLDPMVAEPLIREHGSLRAYIEKLYLRGKKRVPKVQLIKRKKLEKSR